MPRQTLRLSPSGKVTYISDSVSEIIGFERQEGIGRPASDFAHPDDVGQLYHVYQEMIHDDKAACLLYLRIPHKDPRKGYVLCCVTCSRVGRHLVGGVSPATSGVKAMYNASTAQEVYIIAPTAAQFEIRRWNDPAPTPSIPVSPTDHETPPSSVNSDDLPSAPSPVSSGDQSAPETPSVPHLTLSQEAAQSSRTALILDRFSMNCTILHITNDDILSESLTMGRSFYDFVTPADEEKVRSAMDTVKGWGVNERGHPSDGGFAFYRFNVLLKGRNSSVRAHDPAPARNRHAQQGAAPAAHPYREGRGHPTQGAAPVSASDTTISTSSRSRMQGRAPPDRHGGHRKDEMVVDAIFSPQSDGIIVILRRSTRTS
ncbi:hypothetical protein M0805_005910 [Coniferiporia weirii]|nr:hypothetical protein M0805_005910 [Coniferiporia weirii]